MSRGRWAVPLAIAALLALALPATAAGQQFSRPTDVEAVIPVKPGPAYEGAGYGSIWALSQGSRSYLSRIDPTTNQVTAVVRLGGGQVSGDDILPGSIAAGSGSIWVSDYYRNRVDRVDAATAQLVAKIPAGRTPSDVVAGFGSVFVANLTAATVSRIDPATNKVMATISVGDPQHFFGGPNRLAIIGDSVWATVPDSDQVVRIDPATNTVVQTENVAPAAACGRILEAPDGFWLDDSDCSNTVSRYDLTSHSIAASFTVDDCLLGAAVFDGVLYTAQDAFHPRTYACRGGSLVKRDLMTGDVVATQPVGSDAFDVIGLGDSLWTNNFQYTNRVLRVTPF